jgi:hypothetical protein
MLVPWRVFEVDMGLLLAITCVVFMHRTVEIPMRERQNRSQTQSPELRTAKPTHHVLII